MVLRHFPPGTRVSQPQGGYFLWVQLPDPVDTLALHRADRTVRPIHFQVDGPLVRKFNEDLHAASSVAAAQLSRLVASNPLLLSTVHPC